MSVPLDFLPVFLDLRARLAVVIGGGEVAARKVALLRAAGAKVRVVAPQLCAELAELAQHGAVSHVAEPFAPAQLDAAVFVIAATDDPAINAEIQAAGRERRLFVNAVDDAGHSDCLMPAIIDRSPVIVAVSTGGQSPTLARRVRAQIEALLPAQLGAVARAMGRWRTRARAALPDMAARRQFWDRWLSASAALPAATEAAPPDQGLDRSIADELQRATQGGARGEVWLIGAGPGDPDLLSLRAMQLLGQCDVVLYDRLVPESILSRARRDARRVYVGKESGQHRTTQQRINELLIDYARRGLKVARLKGGDPLVFARGGEELAALKAAGVSVSVVPGVTAASGAAASAQISLTHRGVAQAVCLVTAMGEQAELLDWRALAAERQTTVFYMGAKELPRIVARLREHGAPPGRPALIVERATLPGERLLRGTLADIAERAQQAAISAPALLIVGEVVG